MSDIDAAAAPDDAATAVDMEPQEPQENIEPAAEDANESAFEGAPEDAGEEAVQPSVEDVFDEAALAIVPLQGKKRKGANSDGLDKQFVRKPRWGDKSFEEITIADVETIVRRCNSLEQQVEANAEAAQELKESKKRERELERQIEGVGPKEVAMVKSAMAKQFLAQMTYVDEWNSELKNGGREVMAYLPNVSPDLLVALGGDLNQSKGKQTKTYFGKVPSKGITQPTPKELKEGHKKPGGTGLVLCPTVTLRYIKSTKELQIKSSYRFGECEVKVKGRGKGTKKKQALADGDANQDDEGVEEGEEEEAFGDMEPVACSEGGA